MSFAWVACTLFASAFQVARNGLQRSVMGRAGPWGATLVRFLFGLPVSLALAGAALGLDARLGPAARLQFSPVYWETAALGAASQLLATASLLVAMRRAGFAVGTALQQSSLPMAALIGLAVFHDRLSPSAWAGVGVATAGLAALTWPRHATGPQPLSGALFGLLSGLAFGFSLNAFGHAGRMLEPMRPVLAAVVTVAAVQAMQTAALGLILLLFRPRVLVEVARGWRTSLGAGVCGSLASTGWFVALALAPAASVRAVGVVEAPMAALAGRRLFGERLHPWQIVAGVAVAAGVALTARG